MKRQQNTRKWLLLASICMVMVVGGTCLLMWRLKHEQAKANRETKVSELAQKTPGTPEFSFDSSAVTTWRQGPTDKVSMVLFDKDETTGCWMSIEHRSGSVSESAELKKIESNWTGAGLAATKQGDLPMVLKMKSGTVPYMLHQYSVVGTANEKTLGGQEFAYAALSGGYIKVQGYCNEFEKLATITPALQAIVFTAE